MIMAFEISAQISLAFSEHNPIFVIALEIVSIVS